MQITSVLCVCTGNICRSPLAEAYLRQKLAPIDLSSAGIAAVVGHGAESTARQIAAREGLDVDSHVARQIDGPIVSASQLILVMEKGQKDWVCNTFPESRGRVFIVSHWGDGQDVVDPFRRSSDFFDTVYDRMTDALDHWVNKLSAR
ncbi:MAG: low molecular weight phosphotyrosine protein phosphatase [Salinisphaera sp.]|jgi:protein-tyrosine phosphatase|nr:low molecular weight phosphotyrosine protein phosphatase [Salinisphaera sp.]